MDDVVLELVAPDRVQLVDLLVLPDDELSQVVHKRLRGFSVLFRLQSVVLCLLRSVLLGLLAAVSALLLLRREDRRCGQDLVKVLELLACPLLISVGDALAVDLRHVGEAVDDERAQ